jgi:rare lipoprotein A (peptidoglycan hydrolase)
VTYLLFLLLWRGDVPTEKPLCNALCGVIQAKRPLSLPATANVQRCGSSAREIGSDWKPGVVTTYAGFFEGRRTASGRIFRHSRNLAACRGGIRYGTRVELRYGRHTAVVVIADTGRLPLTRKGRPQFDLSRATAKRLGLYRLVNGHTDRQIRWRVIR